MHSNGLKLKSILSLLVIVTLLVISFIYLRTNRSYGGTENKQSKTGFYFDTVITVTVYDRDDADALISDCFEMAERYEKYFSATLSESDISRINSANGKPVTVHDETAELIQRGLEYSEESGGLFDISIGAESSLWNFTDDNVVMPPDEALIEDAVSHVSYKNIIVDNKTDTVTLLDPDMRLDLGGIAKGYIADEMKAYLIESGVKSAIINLGGNVEVIGARPDGEPFTIGIQKPFSDTGEISARVRVSDMSVVTSGTYQRYFIYGDVLYHHIIDPATGYPEDNTLDSVTIITSESLRADALSTAVFLMGEARGYEYVKSHDDLEAIFIDKDGAVTVTDGLKDLVEITK